ncbi:hypothetical protein [uncultured Aquimonas sp.]|uniref:hypothetical protein n=1 Tax=uncultured Aquimonas sp. TaxID=385483 RepID=UPI0008690B99|nr:hypothetical protein [uncultured Aquimonas sp.]ODU44956.1 MAG: hypothetical protein ABS96_16420 [Xanthomonadaceae bacterium SCN 69-123]
MTVPEWLIEDARQFRCLKYVASSKTALTTPFGSLRARIVASGELLMFVSSGVESELATLGIARLLGVRAAVWRAEVKSEEDLDRLSKNMRRLPCSAFAMAMPAGELCELVREFSSAAAITNPSAGFGSRAQSFAAHIAKQPNEPVLLTFDSRDDGARVYYSNAAVEVVIQSLEGLTDYR